MKLQINIHNLDRLSKTIREKVRDRVAWLESYYDFAEEQGEKGLQASTVTVID